MKSVPGTSAEATAIKSGTDAEPMRVRDAHILKMLLDTYDESMNESMNARRNEHLGLQEAAEFLAGRCVVLTVLLILVSSRPYPFIYNCSSI